MITTCLLAVLAGLPAAPYDCSDFAHVATFDLHVTAYDPELGGLNCEPPCDMTAVGYYVPDHYGKLAACPLVLLQAHAHVRFAGRDWYCGDTGGAVTIDFEHEKIHVDLLMILHDDAGEYALPADFPWYGHATIDAGDYVFWVP